MQLMNPKFYNLTKKAQETQNFLSRNTECHPKPNEINIKYSSAFRTKDFVPHKYEQ